MSRSEETNPGSSAAGGPPYRRAAREVCPEGSQVQVGSVVFGGSDVVVMAGPCAIEGAERLSVIGRTLGSLGVQVLRGGAFKPRTSPYAFQGLGLEGYRILREVADENGMLVVSEVMSERHVEDALKSIDILQVGSRSMQNFTLLKELASVDRPVLLKRGMSATYEELLAAAEYLLAGGNERVILCERGIRSFETETRNTLDVAAVPTLKRLSHLPVVVDPSHAAGRSDLVPPLARAAVAAGADGLLIEVHHLPEDARSDGPQALLPEEFEALLPSLDSMARVLGRRLLPGHRATVHEGEKPEIAAV